MTQDGVHTSKLQVASTLASSLNSIQSGCAIQQM